MSSNRNATVTVNTKANTSGIDKATQSLKTMDAGFKGTLGSLKQFKGAIGGLVAVQAIKGIADFADKAEEAYKTQWKAEKSINDALYSNMTVRGASQKEIDNQVTSYKNLASQLQQIGVIGDEVTLSGMGLMTQMGLEPEKVKELTPLLQDLAVKQYGLNVSSEQFAQTSQAVAQMVNMGKLTLGNYGIQVTDTERKQFKAMNQTQRYAFVMNKLKNSVAGTNEAMAKTSSGKIVQMNNEIGDAEEKIGQLVNIIKGDLASVALPVVKELVGSFQEFFNVMSDSQNSEFKFLSQDTVDKLAGIRDGLSKIWDNVSSIFGTSGDFGSNFGLTQGLLDILNGIVSALATASEWASTLDKQMRGPDGSGGGLIDAMHTGIGLATEMGPIGAGKRVLSSITGQGASGDGYWKGGRMLVGEYGPEIVDLPRGSSVNSNAQTQRELSGGSGYSINCPVTIQGNVIGNDDFVNQIGQAISSRVGLALSNC